MNQPAMTCLQFLVGIDIVEIGAAELDDVDQRDPLFEAPAIRFLIGDQAGPHVGIEGNDRAGRFRGA